MVAGKEDLEERAARLFSVARLAGIDVLLSQAGGSEQLLALVTHEAALDLHKGQDLNFFATAAWAYFALMGLKNTVSPEQFQHLANDEKLQTDATREWSEDGFRALADCLLFVESKLDLAQSLEEQAQIAVFSVGTWVLWNFHGEQPSTSDLPLAGEIGALLLASAKGYWV